MTLPPTVTASDEYSDSVTMARRKNIALIAHDSRKADLLGWAAFNRDTLAQHRLFATGSVSR